MNAIYFLAGCIIFFCVYGLVHWIFQPPKVRPVAQIGGGYRPNPSYYADTIDLVEASLPTGWQGWEGGECPVPDDVQVVVMLRKGHIAPATDAYFWEWNHYNDRYDIVAWRVAD